MSDDDNSGWTNTGAITQQNIPLPDGKLPSGEPVLPPEWLNKVKYELSKGNRAPFNEPERQDRLLRYIKLIVAQHCDSSGQPNFDARRDRAEELLKAIKEAEKQLARCADDAVIFDQLVLRETVNNLRAEGVIVPKGSVDFEEGFYSRTQSNLELLVKACEAYKEEFYRGSMPYGSGDGERSIDPSMRFLAYKLGAQWCEIFGKDPALGTTNGPSVYQRVLEETCKALNHRTLGRHVLGEILGTISPRNSPKVS